MKRGGFFKFLSQIVFQIPKQLWNAFQCIKSRASEFRYSIRYSLESGVCVRLNERLRDGYVNFALNKSKDIFSKSCALYISDFQKIVFYEIDIDFEGYNQRFRKFITDSKGKIFRLFQAK